MLRSLRGVEVRIILAEMSLSLASEVAIDLGTAMTRLLVTKSGVLVERPTVLPGPDRTSHPLRGGVVVDVGGAAEILEPMIRKTRRFGLIKPRALACVPGDATADECAYLEQAARAAGAGEVKIVPEALAAAHGSAVDVASEYPQMLADLGDGVTDLAVFSRGEILTTSSLRAGCSDLRVAISDHVGALTSADITEETADRLMRTVCSGDSALLDAPFELTGGAGGVIVRPVELVPVIRPHIERIAEFVAQFIFELPGEIAVCVIEDGITLAGGGALLPALRSAVTLHSGVQVRRSANPLHAVIHGAGAMIANRNGVFTRS